MNSLKTHIVAFKNDFRKIYFIDLFFINSTPNAINKNCSNLFRQIYNVTFGYNGLYMRWHTFDLFWLGLAYSLFLTAVGLFHFTICSMLSTLPFQRCYQCYHYVMQSCAFGEFYSSLVQVTIYPDESLQLVG